MRIEELVNGQKGEGLPFPWELQQGTLQQEITGLVYDSRKVEEGSLFICISGTAVDAHQFIPSALEKGAAAIVAEHPVDGIPAEVTVIVTPSSRKALAFFSAAWFGYPAGKLTTIGITGTKGKTTTSYMIQKMLELAGHKVGVIGTIGAVIDGVKSKTANTTPESYELQSLFARMAEAGCEYCVMEVSSQGLKMDRVEGFLFDYGMFTNFSADHIGPNEHASMEEYLHCKSLLFNRCRHGIVNMDDPKTEEILAHATCTSETYGMTEGAGLRAYDLRFIRENGLLGMRFLVTGSLEDEITVATPGRFSIYNSLAALAVGIRLGLPADCMKKALSTVHVPGRVEMIPVSEDYSIMIDYAHNAASVESLLTTLREYEPHRIICVYGCGGNRSKMRRYDMGELCGRMADLSILTCDNPRDEEVEAINGDIKVGLARSRGAYLEIPDRTEAIHYSMDHAQKGDIIVLLGKGHEDYQEIKGKKYYYREREVVEEYAKACNKTV